MTDNIEEKTNNKKEALPQDTIVETQHTLTIHGQTIPYTVTCGTIVLKEEATKQGDKSGEAEGEKARATIFFSAYTRNDVDDINNRPITFCFNGGPGSSSVWLHLGMFGPKRVLMDEIGNPLPPPYKLVENEHSLLDQTDLVFIDPVSTGYSRVVPGEKATTYHGFKKDIESVGDFIRLYTSRYRRWMSPKFLAGESYGTTRSAGLSGYLQDRHGMYLNGIILISAVLDFSTLRFTPGNDLPYILFLPTYTATAWYHHRVNEEYQNDLKATMHAVTEFALGEYTLALMQGAALSREKRTEIVQKLTRFTGLSSEYIEQTDLRINIYRFTKELLRDEQRTVGRLDSRFKGIDRDSAGELFERDPSMSAIMGPYTATLNHYLRAELNFPNDLPYEILNSAVHPWSYAEHENQFVNVAETLRKAISTNPHLKVFVANGYYDLATPFLATKYTFNHIGLDNSLMENIQMGFYEAGHMMYIHQPSLAQLRIDLVNYLKQAKN